MKILLCVLYKLKKLKYLIFYKLGVKKRLMLFFSVIIILPLLSVSIISYFRFSAYVGNKTLDHKMEITRNALDEILSNKIMDEKLSDQVLKSINTQLIVPEPNNTNPYGAITNFKTVSNNLGAMQEMVDVNGILVIGEGNKYFYSNTNIIPLKNLDVFKDSIKYQDIFSNIGKNVWVPLYSDVLTYDVKKTEAAYLYIIRMIDFKISNMQSVKGTTIIQLKQERYFNVIERTLSEKGEYAALVDSEGIILCHTKNNELMGTRLKDDIFPEIKNEQGAFRKTIDNTQYLVQYTKNIGSGWSIIQYIPYDNILAKSREIRDFTLIVMGIFLIIAMLLSLIFSKNISDPVIRMKKAMDTFGEGNLKYRIQNDREDEFGRLYESFNIMTEEIKVLLQKIDENSRQRRKLELNILEYQINPHFLYNTLESINWMAQKAGHTEIGDIVSALAKYFRIGLSKGKEQIRIEEELEHVNNYLIIYQFRYMGCFKFVFDIEKEILQCKTVKLIIQPLVENAIKYGISKSDNTGYIKISGRKENDRIIFEVEDNGKGIEESKLSIIKKMLKESMNPEDYTGGIGLVNVNQRIKLNFGENYGIDIESQAGYGTKVTINIPVIY